MRIATLGFDAFGFLKDAMPFRRRAPPNANARSPPGKMEGQFSAT
jgi:hypothetical protein